MAADGTFRLGIDGRALRAPAAGIGRYCGGLLAAMARQRPHLRVVVYLPTVQPVDIPAGVAWEWRTDPWWPRRGPQTIWMRERVGGLLRRDGIDAFWAASMALPRCPAGIPGILSVYDVVHVVARSSMSHAGRLVADLFFAGDLDRADSTVAISRGTAERIAVLYGRMVDAIARPDAEPDFAPAAPEAVAAVRARHGLDGRYALTVGTLEPRKNYPLLVRAIAEAKARDRLGDLVMAVAGRSGWGGDALAGSGGLPVRQLGFVDRADLPALMTGAEALLFPTAYEGFGMPALEAARCGTPVVAGDLPELHEAAGDALRTCPLTVEGLADALADIAAGRIARPRPAAARGWDDAARTMWDEIDRTLARPGRADQADGVASVHTRSPWRAR